MIYAYCYRLIFTFPLRPGLERGLTQKGTWFVNLRSRWVTWIHVMTQIDQDACHISAFLANLRCLSVMLINLRIWRISTTKKMTTRSARRALPPRKKTLSDEVITPDLECTMRIPRFAFLLAFVAILSAYSIYIFHIYIQTSPHILPFSFLECGKSLF